MIPGKMVKGSGPGAMDLVGGVKKGSSSVMEHLGQGRSPELKKGAARLPLIPGARGVVAYGDHRVSAVFTLDRHGGGAPRSF